MKQWRASGGTSDNRLPVERTTKVDLAYREKFMRRYIGRLRAPVQIAVQMHKG